MANASHAESAPFEFIPLQLGLSFLDSAARHRDVSASSQHLDLTHLITAQTAFAGQCSQNVARAQLIFLATRQL